MDAMDDPMLSAPKREDFADVRDFFRAHENVLGPDEAHRVQHPRASCASFELLSAIRTMRDQAGS